MGKHIWRRRRFLKRKYAEDSLVEEKEAGRAPSGGKRATYMDTTALFTDKDLTQELTTNYESLFNEENVTEARAVDFWQNSWTAGKDESEACDMSTAVLHKAFKTDQKKKNQQRLNHSSTRRKLERKMQEPSRLTKAAAVLLSKEIGWTGSGQSHV